METLWLIPTPIHEGSISDISPEAILTVKNIQYFIVENTRTARRCLRQMGYHRDFDTEVRFYELDKHHPSQSLEPIRAWLKSKVDIGLMSEAGMPCIADPGSKLVELAHRNAYRVTPLVGPSSIVLALTASGLNGQNFAFNGYLPIDKSERMRKLKLMETRILQEDQTQIFMETPYRNNALLETILKTNGGHLSLCIASEIGSANAFIHTKKILEWRAAKTPDLHKKPTVFCLGNPV